MVLRRRNARQTAKYRPIQRDIESNYGFPHGLPRRARRNHQPGRLRRRILCPSLLSVPHPSKLKTDRSRFPLADSLAYSPSLSTPKERSSSTNNRQINRSGSARPFRQSFPKSQPGASHSILAVVVRNGTITTRTPIRGSIVATILLSRDCWIRNCDRCWRIRKLMLIWDAINTRIDIVNFDRSSLVNAVSSGPDSIHSSRSLISAYCLRRKGLARYDRLQQSNTTIVLHQRFLNFAN